MSEISVTPQGEEDPDALIERTGRWWENPWWERPDCNVLFTVPLSAVQAGVPPLREHFDAEWYVNLARNPRRNLVFPKLCLEKGTFALEFIAGFGARLARLKNAPNLQRPIRALKEGDGESAFLELEVAEGFDQCGFEVSFPREGGTKSPDVIVVRGGLSIAIECKRLGDEIWEDWESELMRAITRALPWQHNGKDIVVQVALNPRLSEIRLGGEDSNAINATISNAIVSTIIEAVGTALAGNELPCEHTVDNIARVRVAPKEPGVYGSVSGMERSVPAIFRRIFQNGIFRALNQLPKGVPGVVVLFSKHAPPAPFFRTLFDAATLADMERFRDLAGVLVCTLQTWFELPCPTYFTNTHTQHTDAALAVEDVLKRTFRAETG